LAGVRARRQRIIARVAPPRELFHDWLAGLTFNGKSATGRRDFPANEQPDRFRAFRSTDLG
jgi:hypothetical protein